MTIGIISEIIIMQLQPYEIEKIRLLFEDLLRRTQKVEKTEKIKMRSRIRAELVYALQLKNPKPERLLGRWEDKLSEVFSLRPWFRDEMHKLLSRILSKGRGVHSKGKSFGSITMC